MINDINTLYTIFDIVKKVKKPLVKIYPNGNIFGTDEQFASFNMLMSETVDLKLSIPYVFRLTEISAFMRDITPSSLIKFDPYQLELVESSARKTEVKNILINHMELSYSIDILANKVAPMQYNKILYKEENIQQRIPEMFSLKVADGAKMFCIDTRFLMTSFNAIHPANKSDKVDLIIRDNDEYSYVAEWIIYKKKDKYELHEWIRFRKI